MNRPTPRLVRGLVTAALSSALLAAAVGTAVPATAEEDAGEEARRKPTLIQVKVNDRGPQVRSSLFGINHRYARNGFGLWDELLDKPNPTVVSDMIAAGVSTLRFPGGTTATMYHWKDAIGPVPERGCQVEGHGHYEKEGFTAYRHKLAYGPDEYMRVIDATGAAPLMMMPFVTTTPAGAADWVEYMNDPLGGRNPNGGTAWAAERAANGHPAPYGVRRWEVGNESHVAPGRFGFSAEPKKAVQQYISGGRRSIEREELGKACAHPVEGIPSSGKVNQRFEVLFTPAEIQHVSVAGVRWTRVADLAAAEPEDKVYEVQPGGVIAFGDGRLNPNDVWIGNGRIPQAGAIVRATYRNDYSGFFAYAREMHAVDKSIDVCASWGTPLFSNSTRKRRYDCQTAHPITNFSREYGHNWRPSARPWNGPLEGHDRMMMALNDRTGDVLEMLKASPQRSPVWLTEFQPIHGNDDNFPTWSASVSNAVYMASQWSTWMRFGINLGTGGDLLGRGPGAVFGSPQHPTFSVEALVRQAIRPMFSEADRVVTSTTLRNPTRAPNLRPRDSYKALSVVSARGPGGKVWVYAVNRLPYDKVRAKVELKGMKAKRKAVVRRVVGESFRESNVPGGPQNVAMNVWTRNVGKFGFRANLPPHSITVFRVTRR